MSSFTRQMTRVTEVGLTADERDFLIGLLNHAIETKFSTTPGDDSFFLSLRRRLEAEVAAEAELED